LTGEASPPTGTRAPFCATFTTTWLGFGVWGLVFGVWGLVFGIWNLVFGVWGLGFGVWAVGSGVLDFRVIGPRVGRLLKEGLEEKSFRV